MNWLLKVTLYGSSGFHVRDENDRRFLEMKTYNKLVRDKIPQIIETSGKSCDVKVLNEEEYEAALKKKMQEELNEFLEAKDKNEQIHELADLLEVIYSFAHNQGTTIEELENIRKNKQDGRGGFGEKIMLLTVQ